MRSNMLTLSATVAAILLIPACAGAPKETATKAAVSEKMTVSGGVAYRASFPVEPGAVARVSFYDTTLADFGAAPIVDQPVTLAGGDAATPFTFSVETSALKADRVYAVEAKLYDANGDLLLTTDKVHEVPTDRGLAVDLGDLIMIEANAGS